MQHRSRISSGLERRHCGGSKTYLYGCVRRRFLDYSDNTVKYDGLGIRLPTDVALPAYLTSTVISKDLVHIMLSTNSYLHEDDKMSHWDSTLFPIPNKPSIQFEWDTTLIRSKHDTVLANSDQHRRACILLVSTFPSGAWHNAVPSLSTLID